MGIGPQAQKTAAQAALLQRMAPSPVPYLVGSGYSVLLTRLVGSGLVSGRYMYVTPAKPF